MTWWGFGLADTSSEGMKDADIIMITKTGWLTDRYSENTGGLPEIDTLNDLIKQRHETDDNG